MIRRTPDVHCRHTAVLHHIWQRRATGPGPLNSRHRLAHSPRHTPSSHVSGTRCGSRVNLRAGGVLTSGEGSPLVPCRRKRQETRGRSSHPKGRQRIHFHFTTTYTVHYVRLLLTPPSILHTTLRPVQDVPATRYGPVLPATA